MVAARRPGPQPRRPRSQQAGTEPWRSRSYQGLYTELKQKRVADQMMKDDDSSIVLKLLIAEFLIPIFNVLFKEIIIFWLNFDGQ